MIASSNTSHAVRALDGGRRHENFAADRVTRALEEYAASVEAGQPRSRDSLLNEYSDVADELAGCLDSLAFIREVAPQFSDDASVVRGAPDPSLPTSNIEHPTSATLGDFRIEREIGRGGMGVVYEAEQISLGRRVALKVLPFAAMLDRQQLARFKNEARAAATLDHPNIVAIYSVGCERGVHYYAMQLIEGQSLAQVVEQLRGKADVGCSMLDVRLNQTSNIQHPASNIQHPTSSSDTAPIAHALTLPALRSTLPAPTSADFFRTVAQLGIQAADALDHAHQNGVLHRDIKPANLLLDDAGKLWITDFGLARIEQDAGMTMTGDILGTLRYMSPEQALGKRAVVDHRSDIYALGITLYEVLAQRPAFESSDRAALLRAIAESDPSALNKLVPKVPIDLATIVHKAIQKDPADRYATAAEFADDLRRFVDHRPITARTPSLISQSKTWIRRHPATTAASLAVAGICAVALAASLALVTAEQAKTTAALNNANANLRLVAETIDTLLMAVAEDAEAHDQLHHAEEFLADAARQYDTVIARSNDPELILRAAGTHTRLADLLSDMRRYDQAIAESRVALKLIDRLQGENSAAAEPYDAARSARAYALTCLGSSLLESGRILEAELPLIDALTIREDLARRAPKAGQEVIELMRTRHNLAVFCLTTQQFDDADRLIRRAIERFDKLPQELRTSHNALHALSSATCNLGAIAIARGEPEQAERHYRRAVELQEQAVRSEPEIQTLRDSLAKYQQNLAELHVRLGRDAEVGD
jgi:serine/threonine protein kinase